MRETRWIAAEYQKQKMKTREGVVMKRRKKLQQQAGQVRIGGKGTPRRKKKVKFCSWLGTRTTNLLRLRVSHLTTDVLPLMLVNCMIILSIIPQVLFNQRGDL
uniref:Uncharacterized protein n=1 Tax=Cacopsylla melanoneura TaxID=428564 RepID=A0A8D9ECP1_9HEMI